MNFTFKWKKTLFHQQMQQEKLYFQRNKVKCIPLRNYYVYLNNQSVATVMI